MEWTQRETKERKIPHLRWSLVLLRVLPKQKHRSLASSLYRAAAPSPKTTPKLTNKTIWQQEPLTTLCLLYLILHHGQIPRGNLFHYGHFTFADQLHKEKRRKACTRKAGIKQKDWAVLELGWLVARFGGSRKRFVNIHGIVLSFHDLTFGCDTETVISIEFDTTLPLLSFKGHQKMRLSPTGKKS